MDVAIQSVYNSLASLGLPLPPTPPNPEQLSRIQGIVANGMLLSRRDLMAKHIDPRRSIDDECGYPMEILDGQYYDMYLRDPIAGRVVEVFAKESCQVQPTVYESEDITVEKPFEKAWMELGRGLRPEKSFYQDEKDSQIWAEIFRADILSGIGYYGVILLGLDDISSSDSTLGMSKPAVPKPGRKLLYMKPLPQFCAKISQVERNFGSPRFGLPSEYEVTLDDAEVGTQTGIVHWSRVIHIADVGHQAVPSNTKVSPRTRPVFNNLLNLQKLYGGSAEMYWKGAFPGIALSAPPQVGGRTTVNKEAIQDTMEDYINGLQRYFVVIGLEPKSLAPQVVDPTPQINVQIEAICIKLGIPKRVFMGSERGELASSQDDAAWNDRLRDRQRHYITPRIIVPFVDRLINLGVLPEPQGYSVAWPDLTSQSELEKADVAIKRTSALAQYVTGGVYNWMSFVDYLVYEHGVNEKDAIKIAENGKEERQRMIEEKEENQRRQAALQQEIAEEFGVGDDVTTPNRDPEDTNAPRNGRAKTERPFKTSGTSRSKPGSPATRVGQQPKG